MTGKLFHNTAFSDVTFAVKRNDGRVVNIPAHRKLLASQSSVFEQIFRGLRIGSSVDLGDVSVDAFLEYLQFFYAVDINLSTENIAEVLKLISKFNTKVFLPICEAFMLNTLTGATALKYFELGLSFNLSSELTSQLRHAVGQQSEKIIRDIADGNVSWNALINILRMDEFACNESEIFNSVMSWAEKLLQRQNRPVCSDNIRDVLGECLFEIRFSTMTMQQLMRCLEKFPDLLSVADILDIKDCIMSNEPITTVSLGRSNSLLAKPKTQQVDIEQQDAITGFAYRFHWNWKKSSTACTDCTFPSVPHICAGSAIQFSVSYQ